MDILVKYHNVLVLAIDLLNLLRLFIYCVK